MVASYHHGFWIHRFLQKKKEKQRRDDEMDLEEEATIQLLKIMATERNWSTNIEVEPPPPKTTHFSDGM